MNTNGKLLNSVFDSALQHFHQNNKWKNIFFQEQLYASSKGSLPKYSETALVAHGVAFTLFFPSICIVPLCASAHSQS